MSALRARARVRMAGVLFGLLLGWSATLPAARAQNVNGEDQIQAHLQAGEFGPARNAALGVGNPQVRDQLLGDIAAAQARAGAGRGSLETATDIASDRARSTALQDIRAAAGNNWLGRRGGGAQADFGPLIELITTTIEPDSWSDVGGPGSVSEFAGGVRVDSLGLLRRIPPRTDAALESVRKAAAHFGSSSNPRKPAALRKISLNRLERELSVRQALGQAPDETMQLLAGLQRIKYILIYPETGDIVIAGPAGDWQLDREGRWVDAEKRRPIVQLDDLVVAFRNAYGEEGKFGCSINPTKTGLAEAQAVNDRWAKKGPMLPSQRPVFLEELRAGLGQQDIVVYGIDPQTRAARVLVEADYRMKLVGMGLEEGTLGVTSYLNSLDPKRDDTTNLAVLRWWFTLNYEALRATEGRDAFELRGPGAKVLSENELLSEQGDRIHTGRSNEVTAGFANSFTRQFEPLAAKYPIYAELRNIFDLALVAAVCKSHDLPGQVNWHLTHFGPNGEYQPALDFAPTKVDSVINHRMMDSKSFVAGVSGGVRVDPRDLAKKDAVKTDDYGLLKGERSASKPKELPRHAWWWD